NVGVFVGNVSPEKQFKFQKAKELHQKGYSIKSIAGQLGAGRKTIRKYIATDSLKGREPTKSRNMTNFSGFVPELLRLCQPTTTFLTLLTILSVWGSTGSIHSSVRG